MKKFKTGGWGKNLIKKVEIVRETAKQVIVLVGINKDIERREAKISDYHNYFATWEQAKAFLVKKALRKVEGRRESLRLAEEELEAVRGYNRITG